MDGSAFSSCYEPTNQTDICIFPNPSLTRGRRQFFQPCESFYRTCAENNHNAKAFVLKTLHSHVGQHISYHGNRQFWRQAVQNDCCGYCSAATKHVLCPFPSAVISRLCWVFASNAQSGARLMAALPWGWKTKVVRGMLHLSSGSWGKCQSRTTGYAGKGAWNHGWKMPRAKMMISALNTTPCCTFHLWDKRCSSPSLLSMLKHKTLQTVLVTSTNTDLATHYHCQYLHCTRLTLCYLLLSHSGSDSPVACQCFSVCITTTALSSSSVARSLISPMLMTPYKLGIPVFLQRWHLTSMEPILRAY